MELSQFETSKELVSLGSDPQWPMPSYKGHHLPLSGSIHSSYILVLQKNQTRVYSSSRILQATQRTKGHTK